MTETQIDQDNQKFLKKLSDDQQQLEDRLDTLQLLVAGFSGRTDIGKAAETANEVRRVTKELKECQQQSSLYNQRERLFELTVTQYDKVGRIHECQQLCKDSGIKNCQCSVLVCAYTGPTIHVADYYWPVKKLESLISTCIYHFFICVSKNTYGTRKVEFYLTLND